MSAVRRMFQLPMMATFSVRQEIGKWVAHALDFDIVCVAQSEETALENLRLAAKTYIEYGLSNGWREDIPFPAPTEFWDRISPETPVSLMPPILIDDQRLLIARARPMTANETRPVACEA